MKRISPVLALVVLSSQLLTTNALAQRPPDETLYQVQAYDALLHTYRGGDVEGATAALDAMLESRSAHNQLATWLKDARRKLRVRDIEAVLVVYSEAALRSAVRDPPFMLSGTRRYVPFLRLVRGELRDINPRSPLLRRWYTFWEALLQGIVDDFDALDEGLDLLPESLAAFPDDSEILLTAGARYELLWWRLPDNSHRAPSRGQFASTKLLARASDYLRRSIAVNAEESEARLRLARVLAVLGQPREGLAVLSGHDWKNEVTFEYLALIIEADLYERLGDVAAAAAAYDKAIPLIRVPQSARVGKAYLEHQSGARQDAVSETIKASSLPVDENDPWWIYTRGQFWRREPYLQDLRSMVQP